jgi:hypothetical protein
MKKSFLQNSIDTYKKDLKESIKGMQKAKDNCLPTLYRTYESRVKNLTAIINSFEKNLK